MMRYGCRLPSSLTRAASLFIYGPKVRCPPSAASTEISDEGRQSKSKCATMGNVYLPQPCSSCGQLIPKERNRATITLDKKTSADEENTYNGYKEDEESINKFVEANAPKRDWKTMNAAEFTRESAKLMNIGKDIVHMLSNEEWSAFCLRRGQLLTKAFQDLGKLREEEDLIAKKYCLNRGQANVDGQKDMAHKKKKGNHKRSPRNPSR